MTVTVMASRCSGKRASHGASVNGIADGRSGSHVRNVCLVVVGALGLTGSAAATLSPAALVRALKTTPYISIGSFKSTIEPFPASANSKAHHSVGQVQIVFASVYLILYVVFPTHQDAVADFKAVRGVPTATVTPAPSFFPKPSRETTIGGDQAAAIEWVDGNVLVLASTLDAEALQPGELINATTLIATSAWAHLHAVLLR